MQVLAGRLETYKGYMHWCIGRLAKTVYLAYRLTSHLVHMQLREVIPPLLAFNSPNAEQTRTTINCWPTTISIFCSPTSRLVWAQDGHPTLQFTPP